jgi:putative hydrolase of the HAD superfamily
MPPKHRIQAITFDAAGTIMQVRDPVGETYARFARDLGEKLSPEALDAGFRTVFPHMPPMAFPHRGDTARVRAERAWWRDLVERVVQTAGHVADFDRYFDTLFAHYASGKAWRAYPEAHGALKSARRRGLRVGIISNFDSRLPPILRQLGFDHLVDTVVYSTQCGAAKPDPRIFHQTVEVLQSQPENTLHVGDNLEADYHGACAAGLRAVHLDRRKRMAAGDIPVIRHLDELDPHLA